MKKAAMTLSLTAVLLSGCAMIPDYMRPDLPVAQSWNDIPGYAAPETEAAAADLSWPAFFTDENLQTTIRTALENNRDLRTSALNIAEARTLYRIDRAGLFPSLNAGIGASIRETSDASSFSGFAQGRTEDYSADLGIPAYELDLFGSIRSSNEAALNRYLATEAARGTVQNALIAETANAYLQLLADRKLLDLTEKTLDAQLRSFDILTQSREQGLATQQDVSRAETAVETARVNLHQYRRFVEQDKNALTLLMGTPFHDDLIPEGNLDALDLPENLDPGLPSDVLLARPDVRQAEYNLLARNADIGAARAAFFPNITLTGTYGFASDSLSDLFTSSAFGAWSFVPQLTLPIFNAGRNRANLDLAEIRKERAISEYEKTIQTAFREVSDALVGRATLSEQLDAQHRLVAAAQNVYDASNARYRAGIDNFLSVLDAQRELYLFQQNEITIELQRLTNLVELYRALGGGSVPSNDE